MTHERCAPYENLVRLHEWLCQRAGSDGIAVYRLRDAQETLSITKDSLNRSLTRLAFYGAIENVSRASVATMLCRVDRINPIFTPMVGSKKAVRVTAHRPEKEGYRPLPELTGYRDPYECSGPLLAHLTGKGKKGSVVSFNLDDLVAFGHQDIVMAALNHLFFKRKIAHMPPTQGDNPKNYTVRILEAPHAT